MSQSSIPPTDGDASLSEEEKAVFERLADYYDDDDPVARISELVVQSSEEESSL